MDITCPAQFLATGCTDITKAASSDATLAGLLATIAAAAIVLVLQASKQGVKQTPFEQVVRNTVLSVLVSTFLSALLASFIFGLLSGEMSSFQAEVLVNLTAPALVVGALQFLLSIGWLLALHQAKAKTLDMARWAFLLVNALVIMYLALGWENLLELKNTGSLADPVYTGGGILAALLIGTTVWAITTRSKRRFPSNVPGRMQKGADYAHRCAKSGLIFAVACTLLFGILADLSGSLLHSAPDWVYYLGILSLMAFTGWFVYISEMSWPPSPALQGKDEEVE